MKRKRVDFILEEGKPSSPEDVVKRMRKRGDTRFEQRRKDRRKRTEERMKDLGYTEDDISTMEGKE